MKNSLSILLTLVAFFIKGQSLLIPTHVSAFAPILEFNTPFVKEHKIKSIVFDIIDKRDFMVAEDKNLINYYEFNSDGKLTRFYYTNIVKTIEKEIHVPPVYRKKRIVAKGYSYTKNEYVYDTISTVYRYDKDNLIMKRFNDGTYYETRYYSYDSKGRLTKEKRFKETNNSQTANNFVLGNQTLISADSFQYVDITPLQYKQVCLNSENRPYKEIIINKDSTGKIISSNEHYTVAWIMQSSEFKYENGILTSAEFKGNANGDVVMKTTYLCDSTNCIYTEKQFKNDVMLKEISYIIERENKLLNSFIARDPINKTMRIVKLHYNYY